MSAKETIKKVFHIQHDERYYHQVISEKDNRAILAAREADLSIKSYVSIMHY